MRPKRHGRPISPRSSNSRIFSSAEPPFLFDWVFEHTLFCAIQPDEREAYVRAVLRWLKPQGQYLAVNYLIPDRDGPPFGTTRDELWQRFSPAFRVAQGMGAAFLPEPDWAGTDALVEKEVGVRLEDGVAGEWAG